MKAYDIKLRCQHCDRFIPVEAKATSDIRIRCNDRKCKQWNDIKVVMLSDLNKQYKEK